MLAREFVTMMSGPSYTAAAKALFAAMTTPPATTRKKIINNLIAALQSAGVWSLLDFLYIMAAGDSQAARLNWKNPGTFTLSPVNSPTFTVDRGYTGDGATSGLNTGYNPNTSSIGMALNDSHGSAFTLTDSINAGYELVPNNNALHVRGRSGVNAAISVSTASNTPASVGGSTPHFIMGIRRDGSNQLLFRNGTQDNTAAVASSALPTALSILGNSGASAFTDRQAATASVGKNLSDIQAASYYSAILTYLQTVGAV